MKGLLSKCILTMAIINKGGGESHSGAYGKWKQH
jgi:hypothetical protein